MQLLTLISPSLTKLQNQCTILYSVFLVNGGRIYRLLHVNVNILSFSLKSYAFSTQMPKTNPI